MGVVIWQISVWVDWLNDSFIWRLAVLAITVFTGSAVYFLLCMVMKVEEVIYFKKVILGKIKRS